MSGTKMINSPAITLDPSNPPQYPDVGDVWAETIGDEIYFYVWDGDKWLEAAVEVNEEPTAEAAQDTPEQAYERAMRVLK